jgi:hypothetical protein
MYKPPNPRLLKPEILLMPPLCQAKIVPFGEERRGYWRKSFMVSPETGKNDTLFPFATEAVIAARQEAESGGRITWNSVPRAVWAHGDPINLFHRLMPSIRTYQASKITSALSVI